VNQEKSVMKKKLWLGSSTVMLLSIVPLVAIFATPLPLMRSAYAQDGQDPIARGCDQDAQILTRTSGGTYSAGFFQQREIIVELRKSDQCQANWVKADVPKGTTLYLKDEQNNTHVPYVAQVNGWNYGDMMNYSRKYRACIKLSNGSEVCTSLV
jgi:hypothetical protein